jgi:NADPH-dependent glutamate synthase beta subunit-like oxidoreductase
MAIVGSDPAGMTAAYYLCKRRGHQVTVFEALPKAGGQLRVGIPSYRLPSNSIDEQMALFTEARVGIKTDHRVESLDDLQQQGFDAILIAAGAMKPQRLDIYGLELPGVMDCVDLLRDANLGNPVKAGQSVAVIGAGNVAIYGACVALRLGAKEVTIVYRRTRQEMPAYQFEVHAAAEEEGLNLQFLVSPMGVYQDGDHLRRHLQCMEMGEPADSGWWRPVAIPGKEIDMPVDNIHLAIGQVADISQDCSLDLNRDWTIQGDKDTMETRRAGVFASGDVVTGPVNVIEAVAPGRPPQRP